MIQNSKEEPENEKTIDEQNKPEAASEQVHGNESESEVDEILSQLFSVQNKPVGTLVHLKLEQIEWLIEQSLALIQAQPMLLRLSAPLTVGTDVHGQYYDLLRLFDYGGVPPESNYLFLGGAYSDCANRRGSCTDYSRIFSLSSTHNRLRGSRQAELGNHLSASRVQDEVPREFLSASWKS